MGALSCKSPYLIFHNDRAELRTRPGFLPKVVSAFHINQPIVVPAWSSSEEGSPDLDVVRALRLYVSRTAALRRSDTLFVCYDAQKRGWPASKQTLARWIRQLIHQAYLAGGVRPPGAISAHSTRSVGSSWAARRGVSVDQLCRAATWSSVHTFMRFYKFDTFATSEASFGRRVLQSSQRSPARGGSFGTSPLS